VSHPANKRTLADAELQTVAAMAAAGARQEDIARRLGCDPKTWRRIRERDERVLEAFERGRSELHAELASKLIEKAKQGETAPLIFLLKAMFSYREHAPVPIQHDHVVRIELPPALTPEQYREVKALPVPPKLAESGESE